jgi:hypothetical protein
MLNYVHISTIFRDTQQCNGPCHMWTVSVPLQPGSTVLQRRKTTLPGWRGTETSLWRKFPITWHSPISPRLISSWKIHFLWVGILSELFQDSTNTLARLFQNSSKTLPRLFQDSSKTLPRLFQDSSKTLPRLCQDSAKTLPDSLTFGTVLGLFCQSSKSLEILFLALPRLDCYETLPCKYFALL